jgi:hypothetical protein
MSAPTKKMPPSAAVGILHLLTGILKILKTSQAKVQRGPDPQERPQYVQGKQADPTRDMNGVGMRVVAFLGNIVRNVMNNDDTIKNHQKNED